MALWEHFFVAILAKIISTEFKHVLYFLCDGHVFLLKLVEMLTGNFYFKRISMVF